uniref:Uncharacterized protein n=1 Tax=Gadus morhua TaxID=8049 RepID=A0A8C5FKV2_GADMO
KQLHRYGCGLCCCGSPFSAIASTVLLNRRSAFWGIWIPEHSAGFSEPLDPDLLMWTQTSWSSCGPDLLVLMWTRPPGPHKRLIHTPQCLCLQMAARSFGAEY